MKKLVFSVGMLLLLAIVLPVSAGPAPKATAGGYLDVGDHEYYRSLIAQVDKNGAFKGQWQETDPGWGIWHAEVTNLFVSGNTAVIGGVVTYSEGGDLDVGTFVCVAVEDNGEGKDAVDKMSATGRGYSWDACLEFMPYYDFIGNIQVTDVPAT